VTLMGALHSALGQWNTSVSMLEVILAMVRNGRSTFEPIVLAFLAEAYLGSGDPLRAQTTAEAAVAAAQRRGTRGFEARARMAHARIVLRYEGASAAPQLAVL